MSVIGTRFRIMVIKSSRISIAAVITLLVVALVIGGEGTPHWAEAAATPSCPSSWPARPQIGTVSAHGLGSIEYSDYYTDADGQRWFVIRSADSNGYVTVRAYPAVGDDGYLAASADETCYLLVRRAGDAEDAAAPTQLSFAAESEEPPPPKLTEEEIKYALLGGNWANFTNWSNDIPIREWEGVTTDDQGRIIKISLNNKGLTGPIPPELGSLTHLEWLHFNSNRLTGPIPPELGNPPNLEALFFPGNQLSGPIPPELARLSKLKYLLLNGNGGMSGPVPAWLGNLANLEQLQLARNQFTGQIPPQLGNLTNLRILTLQDNQLTGPIPPELGNLTNLKRLRLQDNRLTGPIPAELGNLSKLTRIQLSGNQLTGCVPAALRVVAQKDETTRNDFVRLNLPYCNP